MNSIQAKQINIVDYLHSIGIQPHKKSGEYFWYFSPFRQERTPSFRIDTSRNCWKDFGSDAKGSIIDLVMQLYNISTVSEALRFLESKNLSKIIESFSFQKQKDYPESAITIKKIQPISNPVLIQYINNRKIDIELAKCYCVDIFYQVDSNNYFSVGFKNDSGGYELSNEIQKSSTSPKDITTFKKGNDICLVFEGFFDYLTYLTLKNIHQVPCNVVVLNSTINLPKAIPFLMPHKEVQLFLDNDKSGKDATKEIQSVCPNAKDMSIYYKEYKDLNDCLCGKKLQPKLQKKTCRGRRL